MSHKARKPAHLMSTYRTKVGQHLETVVEEMIAQAQNFGTRVITEFNGVQIVVSSETTEEEAIAAWKAALEAQRSSFDTAVEERQHAEYQREAEIARQRVEELLALDKMTVPWYKLPGYWLTCKAQKGELSKDTVKFIQAWAIAMQHEISAGNELSEELLRRLERELDFVGLSGGAYHILVIPFLRKFWKYGHMLP